MNKFFLIPILALLGFLSLLLNVFEIFIVGDFFRSEESDIFLFLWLYLLRCIGAIFINTIFYYILFDYQGFQLEESMEYLRNWNESAPKDLVKNFSKNIDGFVHMVVVGFYNLVVDLSLIIGFIIYLYFVSSETSSMNGLDLFFSSLLIMVLVFIFVPLIGNSVVTNKVNSLQIKFFSSLDFLKENLDSLSVSLKERSFILNEVIKKGKSLYNFVFFQYSIVENMRFYSEALFVISLIIYQSNDSTDFKVLSISLIAFLRFFPILLRSFANLNRVILGWPYMKDFLKYKNRY